MYSSIYSEMSFLLYSIDYNVNRFLNATIYLYHSALRRRSALGPNYIKYIQMIFIVYTTIATVCGDRNKIKTR